MGFKRMLKGEVILAGERWGGAKEGRGMQNIQVWKERKNNIQNLKKTQPLFFTSFQPSLLSQRCYLCGRRGLQEECLHHFKVYWTLRPCPFPVSSCDAGLSPSSRGPLGCAVPRHPHLPRACTQHSFPPQPFAGRRGERNPLATAGTKNLWESIGTASGKWE